MRSPNNVMEGQGDQKLVSEDRLNITLIVFGGG